MGNRSIRQGHAGLFQLQRVLAVVAVAFVVALAVAPLRPYFAEWRTTQQRYNSLAIADGQTPIPLAIQQIWLPEIGVTDRCVSCHIGMGEAGPVEGDALFADHPPVPHEPAEFGCTLCHGGQGRATTTEEAHGQISPWDERLLPRADVQAGCGSCHQAPTIARVDLVSGRDAFERLNCVSCHRLDGVGGGEGPDLSYLGLAASFSDDWASDHEARRAAAATGAWATNYRTPPPDVLPLLERFLRTRVGAPRVVEAQALARDRGCLGCHRVNDRGGEEGPALDIAGRTRTGDLDFARVPGDETLVNYLRRHLLDPAGVVPGSLMPPQSLDEQEADLLTGWILSLRRRELPAQYLPDERIRRTLLAEPEPLLTGAEAFGVFCNGCHGPRGEGRNYANVPTRFPFIGSHDFLDVASDDFLVGTITEGRPGRRMPALAGRNGSLAPDEVTALVAHLRGLVPPAPDRASVEAARPEAELGAETYRRDCAVCHGRSGEGTALGSPLATADGARSRDRLHAVLADGVEGTAMPAYRAYDATEMRAVVDAVLALPRVTGSRSTWRIGEGSPDGGRALYQEHCAGCHGESGEGRMGPALANSAFRKVATPAYLAATIARGRAGTPMPAFSRDGALHSALAPEEILDVSAFIMAGLPNAQSGADLVR